MSNTRAREPLATVDVRTLNTVRWGPVRHMFPGFVEEIELGRFLKGLLASHTCKAVEIEPHCENNAPSSHVFDVFLVDG